MGKTDMAPQRIFHTLRAAHEKGAFMACSIKVIGAFIFKRDNEKMGVLDCSKIKCP